MFMDEPLRGRGIESSESSHGDDETAHSSLLVENECPKRRRDALSRAGFMPEKSLIFLGDDSQAPISHAIGRRTRPLLVRERAEEAPNGRFTIVGREHPITEIGRASCRE